MNDTLICWRCKGIFKHDKKDIRPFLYHDCPDGKMTANNNPNNEKKPYIAPMELLTKYEIDEKQKHEYNKRLNSLKYIY